MKTATIVFKTSRAHLSTFLPHECFSIEIPPQEKDLSFASISFTRLENLPWLAGRGYNHCGLYIHDVICRGRDRTVRGKYLSVLFEDRADPITSGREELGYSKVYASLLDEEREGSFNLQIGWEDASFGEMRLEDLTPDLSGQHSAIYDSFEASEGLLHFKYIPRTGKPGECDVQYPTFSPNPSDGSSIVQYRSKASKATLKFRKLGFEQLPTLHHIAWKLADIEISEITHAGMTFATGASDLKEQCAIEL